MKQNFCHISTMGGAGYQHFADICLFSFMFYFSSLNIFVCQSINVYNFCLLIKLKDSRKQIVNLYGKKLLILCWLNVACIYYIQLLHIRETSVWRPVCIFSDSVVVISGCFHLWWGRCLLDIFPISSLYFM